MQAMAGLPVAKKKARAEPNTAWLNKQKKPVVIQVRGSNEYRAWLEKLCRFDHRSVSDMVEFALTKHARDVGFPEPPPER